ncbi:hypothetical protein, partial [Escherichia coli]|uniref:hypothetical protein n=1 Tax=Escherichia coli TaxID=562 RepID=UPI003917FA8F
AGYKAATYPSCQNNGCLANGMRSYKYYEFCVLNELKGALRSGDIWVKGSRRYRNFDDYLIPVTEFEKSR